MYSWSVGRVPATATASGQLLGPFLGILWVPWGHILYDLDLLGTFVWVVSGQGSRQQPQLLGNSVMLALPWLGLPAAFHDTYPSFFQEPVTSLGLSYQDGRFDLKKRQQEC